MTENRIKALIAMSSDEKSQFQFIHWMGKKGLHFSGSRCPKTDKCRFGMLAFLSSSSLGLKLVRWTRHRWQSMQKNLSFTHRGWPVLLIQSASCSVTLDFVVCLFQLDFFYCGIVFKTMIRHFCIWLGKLSSNISDIVIAAKVTMVDCCLAKALPQKKLF